MTNILPTTVANVKEYLQYNLQITSFITTEISPDATESGRQLYRKLGIAEHNDIAAWKYDGKRLAFEISHSLTDGAGVLPYIKSALYLYLSRKTGVEFDPDGFRLPGDEIPETETGNPYAGLDIDGTKTPLYSKEITKDFYRLNMGTDKDQKITYIKLSEKQLMQYCRDYDGSPNAFLSVIFARAVRCYDPESEKPISIADRLSEEPPLVFCVIFSCCSVHFGVR